MTDERAETEFGHDDDRRGTPRSAEMVGKFSPLTSLCRFVGPAWCLEIRVFFSVREASTKQVVMVACIQNSFEIGRSYGSKVLGQCRRGAWGWGLYDSKLLFVQQFRNLSSSPLWPNTVCSSEGAEEDRREYIASYTTPNFRF